MSNIKAWIEAFRLRTLPLALSSVWMGGFLASFQNVFSWEILVHTSLTTLFLQVLSNLANDYGDFVSGADSAERIGPDRMVASGRITAVQMKRMIILFVLLSLISGVSLLYVAFSGKIEFQSILFFLLGISAIAAAIKYTVGESPYGYSGKGDLFVFLFFGLVGVIGSNFLYNLSIEFNVIFPALAVGCLSTGVLNLNNLRDIHSDKNTGKNTLVVKKGELWGKRYQTTLLIIAPMALIVYVVINFESWYQLLFLLLLPLYIRNGKVVWKVNKNEDLDPELKRLALTTLLTVLLFGIGHILA